MKHTRGHRRSKWRRGWDVLIKGATETHDIVELQGSVMAQPKHDDIYTVWISGHGIVKVREAAIKSRIV